MTWWTPAILVGLGELHLRKGQVEQAPADIAEGLALGERSGYLDAPRWACGLLAERDLMEGRAERARTRLEPVLDHPGQQERTVTGMLPLLAQAYLERGDVGQAQALVALRQRRWGHATDALEQALALSRAMGYPYAEAKGLYVYGLMHQQKGEPKQAAERLIAALTILNQLGEQFYAEHVEQALAESKRHLIVLTAYPNNLPYWRV